MSQTWGFSTGVLKRLSFGQRFSSSLLAFFGAYTNPANTSLMVLCRQLKRWNTERVANRTAQQQTLDLTLDDINSIKDMVHTAIRRSPLKLSDVMSDQLLFLAVGAIQTQSQTGSDKAWGLVEQSIHRYLDVRNDKRRFTFGLFSLVLLTGFYISMLQDMKSSVDHQDVFESPVATAETDADPVTLSMLQLAYQKMKAGTCQLPQAAMLPQDQRQAYLLFVNQGIVEVQHVESLRAALGYVSCLYPQELMRPLSINRQWPH